MIQTLDQRRTALLDLRARVDAEVARVEAAIADAAEQARAPKRHTLANPPPCGSEKGYHWHIRRGEPRDDACRAAHAAHERARAAERRWAQVGMAS